MTRISPFSVVTPNAGFPDTEGNPVRSERSTIGHVAEAGEAEEGKRERYFVSCNAVESEGATRESNSKTGRAKSAPVSES